MRGMVAGAHRRQRPSPRPSRGAVWTGLFLLLAIVAVVSSRQLWSGLAASLFNLGPGSVPQATVLWRATCPPEATCALGSAGKVLLVTTTQSGDGVAAETSLTLAVNGETTAILTEPGIPLAAGFYDSGLAEPPGGPAYTADDWRVVVARSMRGGTVEGAGSAQNGGLLAEDVLCLESGGGRSVAYSAGDAVVTSAYPWVDEANVLVGLGVPDASGNLEGKLLAVSAGGEAFWARSVGRAPVHRVAARPGTGFVAAATPKSVALFDSHGNLLWSRSLKTPITDLAIQSHGGPAVIAGRTLLVYDRRGNLTWRKEGRTPLKAVVCAADRIAVASGDGVWVYDEDGMEKWGLACSASPSSLALDPTARLVAVVLESGTLVVAQAPGATGPAPGEPPHSWAWEGQDPQ